MAESRNEKTSQDTDLARFGGILSGFVRIRREPAGARTQDPNIKSVVLYLLSYGFSGTITAQTVLVVQMYGIYLKMQYPKTFFSCEAPYGSFFFDPARPAIAPAARSLVTAAQSNSTHYNLRTGCTDNLDESPTPESLKCNRMAAVAGNEAANRHKKGGTCLWQVPKVHNVARLTAPPFSRIGNEFLSFLYR